MDKKALIQNEEVLIKTEFEKLYSALETRKKEQLGKLEVQEERKVKEHLIRKNMKEAYQKATEKCSDCEKFLDECYPQHFLEVVPKNEDST